MFIHSLLLILKTGVLEAEMHSKYVEGLNGLNYFIELATVVNVLTESIQRRWLCWTFVVEKVEIFLNGRGEE